jgi:hypothetical protein
MEDNQPVEKVNATPVQTTNVAEAQPVVKKKSKAPIIILVVVLVLVLCCGGGTIFFAVPFIQGPYVQRIKEEVENAQEYAESNVSATDISGLSKVETDEYIFYYPEEYIKIDSAGYLQYYVSTERNDNGGNNNIYLTKTVNDIGVVSDSLCADFGGSLKETYSTMFNSDVELSMAGSFLDENNQKGCQINSFLKSSELHIDQRLFFDYSGANIYNVTAIFDNQESEDYTILHTAQEAFIIK